jgi:hypothetical protein
MLNNLTSKVIKGYANSKLAKGDDNDCFVRAMASSTDVNFDTVHKFVEEKFDRTYGKGTKTIMIATNMMKYEDKGMVIGDSKFDVRCLSKKELTNQYKVKGEIINRKKTVKSFISSNQIGTFIVTVAGHAFTVKNGDIIDNNDEEFRPTRKVLNAYKIEDVTPKKNIQLEFEF